jgi:hypothetical protein
MEQPIYFERRIGSVKRYGHFAYEVGRTVPGERQPYAGVFGSGERPATRIGQGRNRNEAIADFELKTGETWKGVAK